MGDQCTCHEGPHTPTRPQPGVLWPMKPTCDVPFSGHWSPVWSLLPHPGNRQKSCHSLGHVLLYMYIHVLIASCIRNWEINGCTISAISIQWSVSILSTIYLQPYNHFIPRSPWLQTYSFLEDENSTCSNAPWGQQSLLQVYHMVVILHLYSLRVEYTLTSWTCSSICPRNCVVIYHR